MILYVDDPKFLSVPGFRRHDTARYLKSRLQARISGRGLYRRFREAKALIAREVRRARTFRSASYFREIPQFDDSPAPRDEEIGMGTNRPHRLIPGTLLLTFAVLCLCNCASNGGSVPAASPHAAGEPQIDHRAFVAVHIKRGPKRPLEISPGPPEGDTNDECITVPTGWECVIQGGTNTDGAFDSSIWLSVILSG